MRIEVTAQDIRRGRKGDPCRCPVALSLKRAIKRHVNVAFGYIDIESRKGPLLFRKTPASVCKFIQAFDNHDPVKPFSFCLTLRGL